jgi:hypothetical protein
MSAVHLTAKFAAADFENNGRLWMSDACGSLTASELWPNRHLQLTTGCCVNRGRGSLFVAEGRGDGLRADVDFGSVHELRQLLGEDAMEAPLLTGPLCCCSGRSRSRSAITAEWCIAI